MRKTVKLFFANFSKEKQADANKILDVNNANLMNDIKSYKDKIFSLKEQVNLYKDFAYNVKNKDINEFVLPNFTAK